MATEQSTKTSSFMLTWQYKVLLQQLDQVQLHASDPSCPCTFADLGEWCIPKHLNLLASLAGETAAMDEKNRDLLTELQATADDMHVKAVELIANPSKSSLDLVKWARAWRKRIEPIYYPRRDKVAVVSLSKAPEPRVCTGLNNIDGGQCAGAKQMGKNEVAFTLCLCNGKLVKGSTAEGTPTHVSLEPACPCGDVVGIHHTHPGGNCTLSAKDISEAKRLGLRFMCVSVPEKKQTRCYEIDFEIVANDAQARKQAGNAVPIPLAESGVKGVLDVIGRAKIAGRSEAAQRALSSLPTTSPN